MFEVIGKVTTEENEQIKENASVFSSIPTQVPIDHKIDIQIYTPNIVM